MIVRYDSLFVCTSIFIALLSAFAAHDLAGRIASSRAKWARTAWLFGAASAMGIGIWSMHFIGMFALRMPMMVFYNGPLVLLSLVVAVLCTAITLVIANRKLLGQYSTAVASLSMGGGISGMHYLGMAAMRMPARSVYSLPLVALSIAIAVVISFIALELTFTTAHINKSWPWTKVLSATLMGLAIPTMHYTAMAAVHFVPTARDISDHRWAVNITAVGAATIPLVAMVVLGFAFLSALVDRRFASQAQELEGSEERYRKIIGSAFDAFLGISASGTISDWNPQARATFGWSDNEAIGRPLEDFIESDRGDNSQGSLLTLVRSNDETLLQGRRLEFTARHKSGVLFPAEMSLSFIDNGPHSFFAAFVHDVTERKLTERQMEEAREAAEAASRAKSEFVANMSHEIRTPLNGVIGMTDLALETELTREQREYLATVKLSADSLLSVINDILDFSKIEAGKIELDEIRYDIRECLELTLKTLALRADEKSLELLCDISPKIPDAVFGDSGRLRQIVTNLIGNAIKFTSEGEVALRVVTENVGSDAGQLHFTVSDTGIGIAPEKLETVFHSFSQADTSTTREYGGTGLGLTISRRLVELMGGRIWLESELGKGSHFHFSIPLHAAEAIPKAPEADAVYQVLRDIKVLIIDDNRTNRRILEGMLNSWGMIPTAVGDGASALDHLDAASAIGQHYKLILTDMHMPKMDGFGVVREIQKNTSLPASTIVMLSSGGHRGDAARCQELGIAAYLLKPVRQAELREVIARALGGHIVPRKNPMITQTTLRADRNLHPPLSLLLAEDNVVNQKLAVRLLEKRGHTVSVVDNGREALAATERRLFDLVLMDVQMPEMDGITATTKIRERERASGVYQPIVAMTALVMQGDRDRCLSAGMDGYLSKPLRPAELDETLDVYSRRKHGTPENGEVELPPQLALNLPELLERVDGDIDFVAELAAIFQGEYPRQIEAIRNCIAIGDAEGVRRHSHALKGALANLSATEAASLAASLERTGSSGALAPALATFHQLEATLPLVVKALNALSQEPVR